MADIDGIQRDLIKIRMRCRLFWIILCGGLLLTVLLVPISQGAAKAVGLMWVILSIATWMSPMMSICPRCHKNFHERAFPSRWTLNQCASCGLSLDEGKREG
jgi:hypothetical protein